jgi:hypothetical protein
MAKGEAESAKVCKADRLKGHGRRWQVVVRNRKSCPDGGLLVFGSSLIVNGSALAKASRSEDLA